MTDEALAMQLLQTLGLSTWNDETQSDDVDSSQVTEVLAVFDAARARVAEQSKPEFAACPGCGNPFRSPDFDPRCSSCVESGTGPEAGKPKSLQPTTRELINIIKQALPMTMRNESPSEARAALRTLEYRVTELEKRIG